MKWSVAFSSSAPKPVHWLTLIVIGILCSPVNTMRRGDNVFYSTELISFVDPLKHGFHLILTEEANQYLLVNPFQLPAIYVTAIPLDPNSQQVAYRQILFKEAIHNKMIKILGLHEKSWYYVCLEYETISIGSVQNQTTGTQCRIQRTLDKFGKTVDSTINDVKLQAVGDTLLEFQFFVDTSFPLQLTTYLENGSVPLKLYIIEKPKTLTVTFGDLQSNTHYGRLCLIEEPLVQAYSAMGRNVQVKIRNCFLSKDLRTKATEQRLSPSAQVLQTRRAANDDDAFVAAGASALQTLAMPNNIAFILLQMSIFSLVYFLNNSKY